jgi:hypothetical protein
LPKSGFVRQEEVDFDDFIKNRFGRNYVNKTPTGTTTAEDELKAEVVPE